MNRRVTAADVGASRAHTARDDDTSEDEAMDVLQQALGDADHDGQPDAAKIVGGLLGQFGAAAGTGDGSPSPSNAVAGLPGLVQQLTSSGLAEQVASWVSKGDNKPVDPQQLGAALGPDKLDQLLEAGRRADRPAPAGPRGRAAHGHRRPHPGRPDAHRWWHRHRRGDRRARRPPGRRQGLGRGRRDPRRRLGSSARLDRWTADLDGPSAPMPGHRRMSMLTGDGRPLGAAG